MSKKTPKTSKEAKSFTMEVIQGFGIKRSGRVLGTYETGQKFTREELQAELSRLAALKVVFPYAHFSGRLTNLETLQDAK